jgi:hypothetical protein
MSTSDTLITRAKLNVDQAAPGIFGFGVMEDATQTDAVRSVIIAVADWLDEKATRHEIWGEVDRWSAGTPLDTITEIVRRLRAEVAVP